MYIIKHNCKKILRIQKKVYDIIQNLIKYFLKITNLQIFFYKIINVFIQVIIYTEKFVKINFIYNNGNYIKKKYQNLKQFNLFIKKIPIFFSKLSHQSLFFCKNKNKKYIKNVIFDARMISPMKKNGCIRTLKYTYKKKLLNFFIYSYFITIYKKQLELLSSFFSIIFFTHHILSDNLICKTKIFQIIFINIKFLLLSKKKLILSFLLNKNNHFKKHNIKIYEWDLYAIDTNIIYILFLFKLFNCTVNISSLKRYFNLVSFRLKYQTIKYLFVKNILLKKNIINFFFHQKRNYLQNSKCYIYNYNISDNIICQRILIYYYYHFIKIYNNRKISIKLILLLRLSNIFYFYWTIIKFTYKLSYNIIKTKYKILHNFSFFRFITYFLKLYIYYQYKNITFDYFIPIFQYTVIYFNTKYEILYILQKNINFFLSSNTSSRLYQLIICSFFFFQCIKNIKNFLKFHIIMIKSINFYLTKYFIYLTHNKVT
ncbi:hypothetical protein M951_chr354 (nucleomorph) [Lotharella oceanica]|uniref:Uncharacterized protein n=1 Tax=Lotharella oceanica TaxID=641309 RepID=A0A060DBU0_9EUKA|nr:hypothetical protein M951_chr354 [Lotharella oceanica]